MASRSFNCVVLLCLALAISTVAAQELETEEQKSFYALGVALGARLNNLAVDEAQAALMAAGFKDGLRGTEPRVDMRTYVTKLDAFVAERASIAADTEKVAGASFREEAAKQAGAVTTDSGLIYVEMSAGSGAQPQGTDTVKLHYHGTLRDGTVFDSSVQKGQPAQFALNGVVPCFAEGVQKMKVGGKSKLVCPPDLAYGDRGSPPMIKPGATLVFEVELLEIVSSASAGGGQ